MDFRRIFLSLLQGFNRNNMGKIKNWSISSKTQDSSQCKKDVRAQERPF